MIHKQRWTPEKIKHRLDLIAPLVYRRTVDLPPFHFHALTGPMDPAAADAIRTSEYAAWPIIAPNTYWGPWDTTFVLRTRFTIPAAWADQGPVALFLPLGEVGEFSHPEALVHVDGQPFAACDRHHQEIRLRPEWCDGQPHELALHGWTGNDRSWEGGADTQIWMRSCQVVRVDQATRDFISTVRAALGIAVAVDVNHPAQGKLLNGLDAAFKVLDTREPFGDAFYASVPKAHESLNQAIAQAGPALDVDIYAAGHAHIDVAWLWSLGQTRRKAERTFHTVIRHMEQFPDYKFTQSQPQLYDYIRQDQPQLFETIKERVAEGRWEATGGMWVEADCNISGGESLARQFLLGRAFFRQHFGPEADTPILWLPDVFGYAWNLPQLIIEAGMEYFFTIKIGWSQYNRMPYDSFWWQGLDGTQVLTHFSPTPDEYGNPASTYNAAATPGSTLGTWTRFKQKEQSQELLMSYGYGDGGGGPTREMLENIRELGDFPATPRVHHAKAIDFFRALEANSGPQLPVWKGELYLEYHRGTYTTQARNKRANRKSEFLLHNAEFLAAFASVVGATDYPHQALGRAWELVCLNQFHDIIPGSSIGQVYVDSQADYAEVGRLAQQVQADALATLAETVGADLLMVNPNSHALAHLMLIPDSFGLEERYGRQSVEGGILVHVDALPPYSITPYGPIGFQLHDLAVSPHHLENDFLRVEFNDAGDMVRILDKEQGREVLPPGGLANQFQAFEDRPKQWDAWDVDIFYDDKMWLADPALSVEVTEAGPLRGTIEITRRLLNSRITQRISLDHHSRRIDFHTHVDWREKHILLKVAFPVAVHTPAAAYEVQWGHVERPTHRNTSWDWARFETAAQKWVDVSEGDYGVSLLNDCKYGHDIQDNAPHGTTMRLSLLRSSTKPDPNADQGEHEFSYGLLLHAGRLSHVTLDEAYAFNNPPFVYLPKAGGAPSTPIEASHAPSPGSLVHCDSENMIIETVKQAEDGNGLIVRLYEGLRRRGTVTLRTDFPLAAAWRTNLLEENQAALDVGEYEVSFDTRPFQIITLRLVPAAG
ncbi:MAG: alpha-mannosidase [Caldilineaceae bacterium]|nr:alpha-mannosidase [Caldilineaceae bacterium]MBP8109687.1 alpha-mannosidase [Caldilineaceae bacterium]MBP8124483.1 alpha-mannosidase [Caldilineaceae bacterium]